MKSHEQSIRDSKKHTHTIKADGAPFDENGQPLNEGKSTAGEGRALCSCGEVSLSYPTRKNRKDWHVEHKIEALAALDAAFDASQAEWDDAAPVEEDEDLLGVAEAGTPTRVDYASGRFWDTLGTGSVAIVEAMGGTTTAVKEDRRTTYLLVNGPEAVQEEASTLLPQLWRDAHEALNQTRRTEAYRDMDADAAWSFGREFMTDFLDAVVRYHSGQGKRRNASVGYLSGLAAAQGV